ncbi:MAG: ABATE domain-containing protein [Thermoanaerobaculales bacterium]|jgi:predicted RNA-binding Zn ribbon-like protein|nr:ABATE domain-containing protein [Thermoanaerobaculales bacterium]
MDDDHVFSFSAGPLCLDFANTCGDRPRCAEDLLQGPGDLIAWGAAAGLLGDDEAGRLRRQAAADPGWGAAIAGSAIRLREAVFGVCAAIAADRHPSPEDLEVVNATLRAALPNLALAPAEGGCCWRWSEVSSPIDRILWPVVRSLADLVTSEDATRIRECASGTCSWLFLDTSRNRSRKWCSMSSCGNRAKARRHYARRAVSD